MELNRKELKKIIYDFNSIASRFVRVDYTEYTSILKKFLAHVDGVEIISEYIKDCGQPTYDVETEVREVMNSYGRAIFDLGETDQHEVVNIYHILKYCIENDIFIPHTIAMSYSSSRKYQDMTKEFNERVPMVLIRHIEGYLTKIGIEMGVDEQVKYSITVNNGQVNLASDNARISATQNNSVDVQQVVKLIEMVRNELKIGLTPDDIELAKDNLDVIENEISQSNPRKGFLKVALTGLQGIKGTVEFCSAVATLAQFVQTIL